MNARRISFLALTTLLSVGVTSNIAGAGKVWRSSLSSPKGGEGWGEEVQLFPSEFQMASVRILSPQPSPRLGGEREFASGNSHASTFSGTTNVPAGMVVISSGVFKPLFRSTADFKEVTVKPFCLDALPVTNEDFLKFVRANPRWQRSAVKRLFADESYLKNWADDLELGTNAPPDRPVTFVSWFAVKAYAQWCGKRLPTTAEWEFVAGAGYTNIDGDADPAFKRALLAWYVSPAEKPAAVGAGRTNYWGAHDLHGLVWEWVSDFNTSMVTGDARGDTGLDRQLFCGSGSAGARDPGNFAAFMRYGFRSSLKADYCVHNLGFRCAKDL